MCFSFTRCSRGTKLPISLYTRSKWPSSRRRMKPSRKIRNQSTITIWSFITWVSSFHSFQFICSVFYPLTNSLRVSFLLMPKLSSESIYFRRLLQCACLKNINLHFINGKNKKKPSKKTPFIYHKGKRKKKESLSCSVSVFFFFFLFAASLICIKLGNINEPWAPFLYRTRDLRTCIIQFSEPFLICIRTQLSVRDEVAENGRAAPFRDVYTRRTINTLQIREEAEFWMSSFWERISIFWRRFFFFVRPV